MRKFLRHYGLILVSVGILAIVGFWYGVFSTDASQAQSERSAEIAELESELTAAEQELVNQTDAVYDSLLGTDADRMGQDRMIISDFLETALVWDDYESYMAGRTEIIEDFGLDEDSQFLTSYLPPAPYSEDAEGNVYTSYMDERNSDLGDFSTQVLSVTQTDYRYMVSATALSWASDDSNTSAPADSMIFLTVSGTGEITDVQGYIEDTDVPRRSSGRGFEVAETDEETYDEDSFAGSGEAPVENDG